MEEEDGSERVEEESSKKNGRAGKGRMGEGEGWEEHSRRRRRRKILDE
jgi:hypothetical protein